jgi:hypothetical protein
MNIGCGTAAIRAISVTATLLLTLALATPVLGGLQCQLQATVGGGSATIVETGEEVLIEGFGFPAGAMVFITYSVDGVLIGDESETVSADGTGMFETTVTPEAGEEGLWTVEADVPKQCTATTAFEVVAAPATPSPSPTPTPAPTPAGELPDVATSEPRTPTALIQGAALLVAAAIWLSRRRLARLVR